MSTEMNPSSSFDGREHKDVRRMKVMAELAVKANKRANRGTSGLSPLILKYAGETLESLEGQQVKFSGKRSHKHSFRRSHE